MQEFYTTREVCELLGITNYTLTNWYSWQKKRLNEGLVSEPYLPQPTRLENGKGRPRQWTGKMIKQLQEYQKHIVVGRNGIYGMYSNPFHKETKKYQKMMEEKNEGN